MFRIGQEIELLSIDEIIAIYVIGDKLNIKSSRFNSNITAGLIFGIHFEAYILLKNKKPKIKLVCSDNTVFIFVETWPGNYDSYYIPFEFIKPVPCLDENLFIL